MDFEWDKRKARENIKKHSGITFEEASLVFFDDWTIEKIDDAHSDVSELRFVVVGLSGTRLLRVTYTVREKSRIISAEKARPSEVRAYNNNRNEHDA